MVKNILLAGVGGQGIILASKILAKGLIKAGYDVKMSEVHGMAQRGGAVTTQVRYGKKVYSPIIGLGEADILVSFETMETARWIEYLKKGGKVVVNDFEIPSAPISACKEKYPEGIIDELEKNVNLTSFNASKLAEEIGNIKTANIMILGALVEALGLTDIDFEEVIRENVKEKFIDINIKAFNIGRKQVK